MQGTIKYHIFKYYDSLPNFTLFLKGNERKNIKGISKVMNVAAILQYLRPETGFINLSDKAPVFHSRLPRKNPFGFRGMLNVLNVEGAKLDTHTGLILSGKGSKAKEMLNYQTVLCQVYLDLLCESKCQGGYIPIRSQMLLSRQRVHTLPRELYNVNNIYSKKLSEYTWAIVFNCFLPYTERHRLSQWIHCADIKE